MLKGYKYVTGVVFIIHFEHISHFILVFLLLTLKLYFFGGFVSQ